MGTTSIVLARGTASDAMKLGLHGDHEFVFARVTIKPGSGTGWHYHPGPVLVTVQSGALTRYDADGTVHCHQAGQSFIEPGGCADVHMGVNWGAEPVVLVVAYVVPADGPLRVEAQPPRGRAGLGRSA